MATPALQSIFGFATTSKLDGYYEERKDPNFTMGSWVSSEYQQQKEAYLNHNFGFREDFVRIHNEWRYTLYKQFASPKIYEGKDRYLFEVTNINYTSEISKKTKAEFRSNVTKLKQVANYLDSAFSCKVLLVACPGKEYYLKEYLPTDIAYLGEVPEYMPLLAKLADSIGINYLDFNTYFVNNKEALSFPLYSKTGIHWTKSGSYYAMDSVVKFMETISGKDLANLNYKAPTYKKGYVWTPDMDIYNSLNLIRPWDELKLPYTELEEPVGGYKPKVIIIADSYFRAPAWAGIPKKYFSQSSEFCYYYQEFFDVDNKNIDKGNLRDKLKNTDFVLILCSVENLKWFTFDFLGEAYKEFIEPKN